MSRKSRAANNAREWNARDDAASNKGGREARTKPKSRGTSSTMERESTKQRNKSNKRDDPGATRPSRRRKKKSSETARQTLMNVIMKEEKRNSNAKYGQSKSSNSRDVEPDALPTSNTDDAMKDSRRSPRLPSEIVLRKETTIESAVENELPTEIFMENNARNCECGGAPQPEIRSLTNENENKGDTGIDPKAFDDLSNDSAAMVEERRKKFVSARSKTASDIINDASSTASFKQRQMSDSKRTFSCNNTYQAEENDSSGAVNPPPTDWIGQMIDTARQMERMAAALEERFNQQRQYYELQLQLERDRNGGLVKEVERLKTLSCRMPRKAETNMTVL